MIDGVELIIQHRGAYGRAVCRCFVDLRLANPVLIAFADYGSTDARAHQIELVLALEAEIAGSFGGREVAAPCGGVLGSIGDCHARWEAACQKLLVLVGDAGTPPPAEVTALSDTWAKAGPNHAILPVFPFIARKVVSTFLPASARAANVAFWNIHPTETLPALLSRASLTVEQPRLFISYRQKNSAALAIQLFDALSHAGFDVFLDHFRIPPGVNFQSRLTQELGDKSLVLLLESEHLSESPWIAHEISVAKSCGLGLLGLLLPRGEKQPSLDDGNRQTIDDADFEGGSFHRNAVLKKDVLDNLVVEIRAQHDRAIVARRRMLELSFENALRRVNCNSVARLGNGAFEVKSAGKDYLVWLTSRPPELLDFYRAHSSVAMPATGVIIGLSRLMEPARVTRNAWLAGLCQLRLSDEGQISQVAREIAGGQL